MSSIYETGNLLVAVEEMPHRKTYIRDTFFPTGPNNVFSQKKVFIDWRGDDRRIAPFVTTHSAGVTMGRREFHTFELTPPRIAPERELTIDELEERGFGEALYGQYSEAERAARLLVEDMQDLEDFIARTEEWMAAQTLINNGCTLKEYASDMDQGREVHIDFFDEQVGNQAVFNTTTPWNQPGADIFGDLAAMARDLTSRGKRAEIFLCSDDVADAITRNEEVREVLDIRNYHVGEIRPQADDYSIAEYGTLNAGGRPIRIISYSETYQDLEGTIQPYIPEGTGIMLAPGCGSTLYGSITQIDYGSDMPTTHTGARVPNFHVDSKGNVRTLTLRSRPICVPNGRDQWLTAQGLVV